MSIGSFNFKRLWTNPRDFPVSVNNETRGRQNMQALFNEIRDWMNATLIPAVNRKLAGSDVVNSLDSEETTKPLSAAQGKALKGLIPKPREWVYLGEQKPKLPGTSDTFEVTLGTGYRAYLLQMDLVSSTGVDVNLDIRFDDNANAQIQKDKAVHGKPGRDTRLYLEMIPGTYPLAQLVDAGPTNSSYGLIARKPGERLDWAPLMKRAVLRATGAQFTVDSTVKVWGYK